MWRIVSRTSVGDIGKFHAWQFKQSEVCAEMAYWIDVIMVSSHVKVEGYWKQTFWVTE
jgi:hypothetical protein